MVKGHVIQAGGGAPKLSPEFNEHLHLVGTVDLGRNKNVSSGDSEFDICAAPIPHLDGKYTVFGQIIEGYGVLGKVSNIEMDEKREGKDKKLAMPKPAEALYGQMPPRAIKFSLNRYSSTTPQEPVSSGFLLSVTLMTS